MKVRDIPEFKIGDIMGEFEVDDDGNFIIIKEKGDLFDKKKRRVNKRGYLVDKNGNVINKESTVMFKETELDKFGEIPAPFLYEDEEYDAFLDDLEKKEQDSLLKKDT